MQVEQIAAEIHARGDVTLEAARKSPMRLIATFGNVQHAVGGEWRRLRGAVSVERHCIDDTFTIRVGRR